MFYRCLDSGNSFQDGFLEVIEPGDTEESFEFTEDDVMLRFHEDCRNYKKSVAKNKTAMIEYNQFKVGPELKEVILSISKQITGDENFLDMGKYECSLIYK